jgi:4-hydroxy-tetrahydrodipicolinate reductase
MGRAIASVVDEHPDVVLGAVWEHPQHSQVGQRYHADSERVVAGGPDGLESDVDVVIDFTSPSATVAHARWASAHGVAMIVGTTGLEPEHQQILDAAVQHIALVQAPNMSVGVNVLCQLVAEATRMLASDYDIEILEAHHRHKVDAPSGTAMRLLDVIQDTQQDLSPRFERHGVIGAREDNEIGIQTLRGGDVVGEHTVLFLGHGERVELTHRATDRSIFARGAVRAALWVSSQSSGRYTMANVLSD